MCNLARPDGVFQGIGNRWLTYNCIKVIRSVFSGGDNKSTHALKSLAAKILIYDD
jgi:hypothetical protein